MNYMPISVVLKKKKKNEKNKEKWLILETLFKHDHNSLYSLLYLILYLLFRDWESFIVLGV